MINIEERRSEKLSGFTSLFLSFTYNENIIDSIKQNIDIYSYNKKTKEWEILTTDLNNICDILNSFDDINIRLYNLDNNIDIKINIDYSNYKLKPFNHQKEAIEFGLNPNHEKFLLLDDMGLGKTASIIHIAEELKKREGLKHCFIICGINTLKGNWKREILLHSNESYRILGEKISKRGNISYGSVSERINEILNDIKEFFIITNIETIRPKEFVEAFKKNVNDIQMIVVDEVHKCNNKQSIQGDHLLKLDARYKIAATGTLLTNSPINAYLPLKWIDMDKSNLTQFKNQYCVYGGFGGHEIVGQKNIKILKDEIEKCSLRRTKEVLGKDLPPKTVIHEIVTMSDEHNKFYQDVRKGVKEEADKVNLNPQNILALTTRLRQATACPSILTSKPIKSSKIDRAVDLASDLIENGEKVVIFSTFKETVNELKEYLKQYKPLICTGDYKEQVIQESVNEFQTNPEKKLIIATWQKLGTGLTLNAASYMIFIDTPFTDASFKQSCDRIYRIGTVRPVFIYNLICENTIDERVKYLITFKKAMSDYVVDDQLDADSLNILKDYILDL